MHSLCLSDYIQGHTNNLVHPALSGLIIDFFYTGPSSVGQLFPEVFQIKVPRVTVAISYSSKIIFFNAPVTDMC